MTFQEELAEKNSSLKKEYKQRVKQERKANIVKAFNGLKKGLVTIVLSPYKAIKSLKKYSTKKKLERSECLKMEKAWLLDKQEGRATLLSSYDKSKIGKRQTEQGRIRHDVNTTTDIEKTIIHSENGPIQQTKSSYSFNNPNPYYGVDEHNREVCYQGYVKLSDKKGKEEIVYVETTLHEDYSITNPNYSHVSYKACYTKDGEHFVKLDSQQAESIFAQFDKEYTSEYQSSIDISKDIEITK